MCLQEKNIKISVRDNELKFWSLATNTWIFICIKLQISSMLTRAWRLFQKLLR